MTRRRQTSTDVLFTNETILDEICITELIPKNFVARSVNSYISTSMIPTMGREKVFMHNAYEIKWGMD